MNKQFNNVQEAVNHFCTKEESTSIIYRVDKIVGEKHIFVEIRLDDECKNGHQDFSITGDVYEAGKPKVDRYHLRGGCIHEDIIKYFPEFECFVNLHLCDYNGVPMHCCANGYYHLVNGFNITSNESPEFKSEYCKYYRITAAQLKQLKTAKNKIQYGILLKKLGILDQWKREADAAIFLLKQYTGISFLNNSVRSNYEITEEQIWEEENKIKDGYYSEESEAKRETERINKIVDKLSKEMKEGKDKAQLEFDVKMEVLRVGGSKALENIIFYNHSKTICFNWRTYDKMKESECLAIIEKMNLPEGVKTEVK